ncbi:hypothetical protein LJC36_01470 [Desulfovibrio sp. OttesenSCG-928-C14]|nr:hypothetical protein [Desulfovibrio sp. OttesenSCG-928-C14]
MQNTGNLNSLTEKLKAKTERERQEMETLTRQQFEALSRSLHESSKAALGTTEAAILGQLASLERNVISRCRILSAAFGWKCLQALVVTLCILAGMTLAGWGWVTLAGNKITKLHREITELSERKDSLEVQTAKIRATFNGLSPYHEKGKDYILTPEGWAIINSGRVGKRDAWIVVKE